MLGAFITGFILGLSLIVAIGAQNAFVLRQGVLKNHVFFIALFCSVADSLLIVIGVAGISIFFDKFFTEFSEIIFGLSSLWLIGYGSIRLHSAFKSKSSFLISNSKDSNFTSVLLVSFLFTFANPHVYLDTMILIGSVSQQFFGLDKILFTIGACLASFLWFFSLGFGGKKLIPFMENRYSWRIFDALIALIMFILAANLAAAGNWI